MAQQAGPGRGASRLKGGSGVDERRGMGLGAGRYQQGAAGRANAQPAKTHGSEEGGAHVVRAHLLRHRLHPPARDDHDGDT